MKHFHERLRHIRKVHGYTQKFVGDKVGQTQSNYCRYEKGIQESGLSFIHKVLKLYNANPEWLISGCGEMLKSNEAKKDKSIEKDIIKGKNSSIFKLKAIFVVSFDDLETALGKSHYEVNHGKQPVQLSLLFAKYLDYQNNVSEVPKIKGTAIITVETFWSSQYVVMHKFLESNDIAYTLG